MDRPRVVIVNRETGAVTAAEFYAPWELPLLHAVRLTLARYPELIPDDRKRAESHREARDGEK